MDWEDPSEVWHLTSSLKHKKEPSLRKGGEGVGEGQLISVRRGLYFIVNVLWVICYISLMLIV